MQTDHLLVLITQVGYGNSITQVTLTPPYTIRSRTRQFINRPFCPTDSRLTVNPTPSLAAWRLLRVTAKTGSNNYKMDLDGTNIASGTRSTLEFPTARALGKSSSSGADFYLNGNVAEFLAFGTKRDATQTAEIRDYMNDYYALSIA